MPHPPAPLREQELARLVEAADRAGGGSGSIVYLHGATGSGKSALLRRLADALAARDEEERPDLVSVLCFEQSAGSPLQPFGEVLRALTSKERRGDRAKRVLELVGQVAPPLVELIPVIGKLASVGVKAATGIGVYALGGDRAAQQLELAADVALALQRVADDRPLVVVVDDAQWIDAASTEVVARLSQEPEAHALLLLVAYDASLVPDGHVLARTRAAAAGRSGIETLELGDLGAEELEAVLVHRYDSPLDPLLAAWLLERTEGSPLFVVRFLDELERRGVVREADGAWALDGTIAGGPGNWRLGGALAEAETPGDLLELLRPRVADLEDEERALLETGAVQGRRFLSTVLVRLLDAEEDAILDRLAQIAERRRLIASEDVDDWWSDRSALYAFDPGALQELLYGRYADRGYERRRRHRAVAEALEALVADDDPQPRHALLEIARHYEQANEPVLAAERLVAVADSTFAEGADRETTAYAERAAELLRAAPAQKAATPEAQGLLARAILLLLLGGEAGWSTDRSPGVDERLLALAAEAERAAEASGDAALRANARYGSARVLTAYRGLNESLDAYAEALELAREAGDPLAEFAILVTYGHQLNSRSLEEGAALLREAHALLTGGALDDLLAGPRRASEQATLETTIGVADFDLGRYGEAYALLTASGDALVESRRSDEAAWSRNFLGQLLTALGLYEAAERALREGIALLADAPRPLGLRGYLQALLGRLYVEWEPPRPAEARTELAAGREEVHAAAYRPVIPLVDGHWAELLLAEGTPEALTEAEEVLRGTTSFGWARSDIAICALLARVALARGDAAAAVEHGARAVTELRDRGGAVPAVRSEEILWTHARALHAAGDAEAERVAAEAAAVVRAKAESLTDAAQRESFETRVRLSREILAGL